MTDYFTPYGRLHTPFRIFLRSPTRLEKQEILNAFSLLEYISCTPKSLHRQTWMIDLDDWLLIADDWFYTLWHLHTTRQAIASLALDTDVYFDVVGECDESYGFAIYQNGSLVREVQVDSPNYSDQILKVDHGTRLPVESDSLLTSDIDAYVDKIAEHLGIRLPRIGDKVLAFSPAENHNEG